LLTINKSPKLDNIVLGFEEEVPQEMKDLVLELINSYENRVTAVESLITSAYDAKADSGDGLSQAYEMGQKLKADLQETLVRNRSLRRADFQRCTARIFNDIETNKVKFEKERADVREALRAYVGHQKELVASLKSQLTHIDFESSSKDKLEAILTDIRVSQTGEGEQIFSLLQHFQVRVKTFRQELEDLNAKLQRTLERGELLKLDDLRHLQSTRAGEQRRAERKVRQDGVQRLLASFNRGL
jgi:hypothetical protein